VGLLCAEAAGAFWRALFCKAKLESTKTDTTTMMSLARFNSVAPQDIRRVYKLNGFV
jgi:hypothetical protein